MLHVILITLLTIVASCIGTITGFGISTTMIPIAVLFIPFLQTIMLVGIVHLFNMIWRLLLLWRKIDWRVVFSFGIPALCASIAGALLIGAGPPQIFSLLLGLFLISYALFVIARPQFKVPVTLPMAVLGGSLSGFSAGIFGIRGPIRSMFLSAYNLPKERYIATVAAMSLLVDSMRLLTYWLEGIRLEDKYLADLWFVIPASLVGVWLGQCLVQKIPQDYFRIIIAVFLLLVGIKFVVWPI